MPGLRQSLSECMAMIFDEVGMHGIGNGVFGCDCESACKCIYIYEQLSKGQRSPPDIFVTVVKF